LPTWTPGKGFFVSMWPCCSATVWYLRLPSQKPTQWGFCSRGWHSTWFHFPVPKPGSQFCFQVKLGMHNFRVNPTGCSSRDSNPGHWPRRGELLTTSPLVGGARRGAGAAIVNVIERRLPARVPGLYGDAQGAGSGGPLGSSHVPVACRRQRHKARKEG